MFKLKYVVEAWTDEPLADRDLGSLLLVNDMSTVNKVRFICLKAIIYSIMLTTLYLTSHSKCRDKLIDYGWKFCPCTHLISARR